MRAVCIGLVMALGAGAASLPVAAFAQGSSPSGTSTGAPTPSPATPTPATPGPTPGATATDAVTNPATHPPAEVAPGAPATMAPATPRAPLPDTTLPETPTRPGGRQGMNAPPAGAKAGVTMAAAQDEMAPKGAEMHDLVDAMRATAKATRESVDYGRVVPDLLTQILAKLDKVEDKLDRIEVALKPGAARRR